MVSGLIYMLKIYFHVILIFISATLLVGCSLSLNITDTHGFADDVVDSTPSVETEGEVNIPIDPLSGSANPLQPVAVDLLTLYAL